MASPIKFRADVNVDEEARGARCLDNVKFHCLALQPEELLQVNAEVVTTVATVVGALPELLALRDEAARLPGFDPERMDDLRDCAYAFQYAQRKYQTSMQPDDGLAAVCLEVTQTRDRLHSDVVNLCVNGVIDDSLLADYTAGTGYKDVVTGTQILIEILVGNWDKIEGKTLRTHEELDRAEALTNLMVRLIGLRDQAEAKAREWADMRSRAFTLLVKNYDQVRKAVAYLRWEKGDADKFAPSLYAGRGKRRADKPEADAPAQQPPAVTPPAVTSPNGPFMPPAPAPTPAVPAPTNTTEPRNLTAGMPGGSPFIQ